jgi:hypothetical protein
MPISERAMLSVLRSKNSRLGLRLGFTARDGN